LLKQDLQAESLAIAHTILKLTFIKAVDLFDTDAHEFGKLDPFIALKLYIGGVELEKLHGKTYNNMGCNPVFGKPGEGEVLELACNAANVAKTDFLRIVIKDQDWMDDEKVGEVTLNLLAFVRDCADKDVTHSMNIYRTGTKCAGQIFFKFDCDQDLRDKADSVPENERLPVTCVYGKLHRNNFMGLVAEHEFSTFVTYEVVVLPEIIEKHFGDHYQCNYDDEHKKIFADDAKGHTIRAGIVAEHAVLYRDGVRPDWARAHGPRTEYKRLQTGEQFLEMLNGGFREGKRRVYTYALVDNGLFFSETGAAMSKDVMSKHAVHANANPKVRYSGTFRICFDNGQPIIVMDNDSGTYRPCTEDGARLKATLEATFAGLRVHTLTAFDAGKPAKQGDEVNLYEGRPTMSWEGPVENGAEQVYPGEWVWGALGSGVGNSGYAA